MKANIGRIINMRGKMIECPICGKRFRRTSPRQIYCSKECYNVKALEAQRNRRGVTIIKCAICGKKIPRVAGRMKYCEECADFMKHQNYKRKNEQDKDQRHAAASMKDIRTGELDRRMDECRRRGISYSQLQQEETWEKIYKGEL